MMPHARPALASCASPVSSSSSDSYALYLSSARRLWLALLLLAIALLAGCATQAPGLPDDPVLSTAPGASPGQRVAGGSLRAITPGAVGSRPIASTEPPKELWDRIRRGFAMPDLQNELVTDREQWYARRPQNLQRLTERSSKYLFHIVEELERRQMPTELALLPFIESAFDPQAVSSAKAAGIWQFMPATGRDFDLRQNVFRDDRRDVLASTRAALDYLQRLHHQFGDWHLALAAYNWGQGSVGRAIAKNQRAGLGTRYDELSMPAETRMYVPKLQAMKNIVADPQAFGTELPLIENHPYFQQVEISRDIDVALAARLADVRIEDFRALNPAARRPVILAAGTPHILLPWDNALVFQRNFDAYSQGQMASWTAWTAPSTMNTAQAARHNGMNETELRSLNNIPPNMLIKAGSTLLVPRTAQMQDDVSSHVADNGQVSLAPEITTRRTLVRARKGESVASIARRFGLGAASVAGWNRVGVQAAFKKGHQVVLYLPLATARALASQAAPSLKKRAAKPAKPRISPRKRGSKPVVKSKRR